MKKLHDLIHSLSQGEKRYVKIRLNGNKSSSLLNTYFEFLSKQKKYSFGEIEDVVQQSKKHIQSNLSLLYDVVLKHLQSHYRAKNAEFGLRGDLSNVKILMDKGLLTEAKSHCKKLIQKAQKKEAFEVLKSAYKEFWNIHLLNGELNDLSNEEIQAKLSLVCKKEIEVIALEEKYRMVTTLYYNYFFKKRESKYQKRIEKITKTFHESILLSDTSRHIYFEIKSIESVVLGDLESHHVIRKKQLKHLIKSPVYKLDNLLRLMVLSNTFTLLKSKALVKELDSYLGFMKRYFEPIMEKGSDSIFSEKYWDIFFTNQCFIQSWEPNKEKLLVLINSFKQIMSKGYISNPLIVGRIYLSLIELLITTENYKITGPLLTEFFLLSKKEKYSKHYMEGDLLFLVEKYLQGKMDTFDNALESFNRKVRRNEIELDQDQKVLLELLNNIFKDSINELDFYIKKIKNKQTYKLFVHKLSTKDSFDEIREKHFPVNDFGYCEEEDEYLNSLLA
jgi:hypothetical protein